MHLIGCLTHLLGLFSHLLGCLSHLLGCLSHLVGCLSAIPRPHSLCDRGTRASRVDVVEVVVFPLAWCRHSTLFQCPSVLLAASLSTSPPVLPYYQELLRSLVSTCFNSQFWLCSLVLLSLTAEPPPGIKPQCVAVASLQTGGLESVLPSTCSLRKLTPRASRPLSVYFYSASLDFAPASLGTVQKGTTAGLHAKLYSCHLAAPTLLSGTVTAYSAGRR
jgi:hypothetical protein